MESFRRPDSCASPSSSPAVASSSWIQLRSLLIVVSSPLPDRGSIKSPWSQKKKRWALSRRRWKSLFSSEGKLRDGGMKFLKKARTGGIDPSIRAEVWPFLLGVYDLNSSEAERNIIKLKKRKEYENLRRHCRGLLTHNHKGTQLLGLANLSKDQSFYLDVIPESVEDVNCSPSQLDLPLYHNTPDSQSCNLEEEDDSESSDSASSSSEELESMATSSVNGDLVSSDAKDVTFNSPTRTIEDYETWQRILRRDALRANGEWVIYSPSQLSVSEEKARESAAVVGLDNYDHLEPCMIYHAARLVAILEAYAIYDPEIGYCQGMSDLLTPILAIMDDDHEAFWCFAGFMRKARNNFRLDEVGIRRQLKVVSKIIQSKDLHLYRHLEKLQAEDCFFVYRMVVVLFRRELTFEQTVCLWEVMWADQTAIRAGIRKFSWGRIRARAPPTDDLLLYAIAACVLQRRKLIIERSNSMDEIMTECNSLSGQLDVWRLLDDANDLIVTLHDKIE